MWGTWRYHAEILMLVGGKHDVKPLPSNGRIKKSLNTTVAMILIKTLKLVVLYTKSCSRTPQRCLQAKFRTAL